MVDRLQPTDPGQPNLGGDELDRRFGEGDGGSDNLDDIQGGDTFRPTVGVNLSGQITTDSVEPGTSMPIVLVAAGAARQALTDGDTTPDVNGVSFIVTANTGATTITGFENPNDDGHVLFLLFGDGNTTLDQSGSFQLSGSVDFSGATGDIMILIWDESDSTWRELARTTA